MFSDIEKDKINVSFWEHLYYFSYLIQISVTSRIVEMVFPK